ncbi:C39 family peptidase [Secundilactobacillus folii]|uniref:Peptidase C39-like domain-containing protein n=1 Tax=Secundilactobacillus folii TaxID=2678357 RepID=A0A7X2XVA7_9LACO|nr:C39 family peptidase [Secundilactobacillus folii]MTV81715.1 hypothetical protein [Secundilactobacillus folii]
MPKLNVPLIAQRPELPTGCEITAVTMMLQYLGARVSKVQLAREMPHSDQDPEAGFVGDPFTDDGNTVYPPALVGLITKYAGSATDLTGADLVTLKRQIDQGHPVVIWVGEFDGFHTHALTLIGYDETHVLVNDCWTEKMERLSNERFARIRQRLGNRAITV